MVRANNSLSEELGIENRLQRLEVEEESNLQVVGGTDSSLTTSMDSLRMRLEGELVAELKKLDLSSNEAKILLYLMSNGSSTASDIARYTKIQRTDTYHYISTLLSKGIIFSTFSKPQKYYSLPYEEVIDYLVQAKTSALKEVAERKLDCKSKLDQISKCVSRDAAEDTYQLLSGESVIFAKASRMLSGQVKKATMFLTDRMLARFYHEGIIDLADSISKAGGEVRIKTSSKKSFSESIRDDEQEVAFGNLHLQSITEPSPASFIILDDAVVLFIIDRDESVKARGTKEIAGIFTNSDVMVSTLAYLFERIS